MLKKIFLFFIVLYNIINIYPYKLYTVFENQFYNIDNSINNNKLLKLFGRFYPKQNVFEVIDYKNHKLYIKKIFFNKISIDSLYLYNENIDGYCYIANLKNIDNILKADYIRFIELLDSEYNQTLNNFKILNQKELNIKLNSTNTFNKIKKLIIKRLLKYEFIFLKDINSVNLDNFSVKSKLIKNKPINLKKLELKFFRYIPNKDIIILKNKDIRIEPIESYVLYRYLQIYFIFDIKNNMLKEIVLTIKGEYLE